jgi:uncharacterized repeat protein (TIGR02543 family)
LRNYNDTSTDGTIYEKYATGWYSNSSATTTLSAATLPTRSGYKFRGYYTAKQADLTSSGGSGVRRITNASSGNLPGNTTFSSDTSLYAAWAQNCTSPAHGTCSLTIDTDGTAVYDASCDNGYTVSNKTTKSPSCTADIHQVWLDRNDGTGTIRNNVGETGASGTTGVSMSCATDTTATLPTWNSAATTNNTTNITKTNRVFVGWSTNSSCASTSCAVTSIPCPIGGAKYYAVWVEPSCVSGTGVSSTSLNSVSGNAPVCNRSSSAGYYCSATQTGTAGATSLTVSCKAADKGYYAVAGSTSQTACVQGSYTSSTGQSSCTACSAGYTNSGTANQSCSTQCTAISHLAKWKKPVWQSSNNTMSTGTCLVDTCDACTTGTGVLSCSVSIVNNACVYTGTCSTGYRRNSVTTCSGYGCSCSVETYTITYSCGTKPSGATSTLSGTAPSSQQFDYNSTYTLRAAPSGTGACSLPGYSFVGWRCPNLTGSSNTVSCGSNTCFSGGASNTYAYAGNVTCYAEWTANTLNINYYQDSAANGATTPFTAGTCVYDNVFTPPTNYNQKKGYHFNGWSVR